MTTNLKALGIDINKTYEIGGYMDNANVLIHYLSQGIFEIDDNIKEYNNVSLLETTKRVKQLLFILEDQIDSANKIMFSLFKQLEVLNE